MYSLKKDFRKNVLFALRSTVPIVLLTILLAFVIFFESDSFTYKIFVFFLSILASTYFIFYMFFSDVREKIVDDITGAFNRKEIFELLLESRKSWVLLISIDNIKEINERYGIENGDKILKKFARHLDFFFSERVQKELPIGRIKGGDFLILVPASLDEAKIKKMIEELLQLYNNQFLDNIEIELLATYALYSDQNPNRFVDLLYEHLYYCKSNCKDKNSVSTKRKRDLQAFEEMIVSLIDKERIALHFQPVYNVKKRVFDLVEIVVRLFDPDGNIIHPSSFVPVINRLGLENDFDLSVAKTLLQTLRERPLSLHVKFSFKLSPYSIRNRSFQRRFFELFEHCAISNERFVVELYEAGFYKDLKLYRSILNEYKEEGFLLGFDRFGACNPSMEYIKEFDVDFVFFDGSFTKNIVKPRYEILLRSWVEALEKLKIKSVVKLVDKSEYIEKFERIGIDYIEGFAIAKPMDIDALIGFLKEENAIR